MVYPEQEDTLDDGNMYADTPETAFVTSASDPGLSMADAHVLEASFHDDSHMLQAFQARPEKDRKTYGESRGSTHPRPAIHQASRPENDLKNSGDTRGSMHPRPATHPAPRSFVDGAVETEPESDAEEAEPGESDEPDAATEFDLAPDYGEADQTMRVLDDILEGLPRRAKIKVLDTQLSQATRALLDKRLEAEQEKTRIFALIISKLSEASMSLLRNFKGTEAILLSANDPIRLWKTIEQSHLGGSANQETQAYQIIRTYQTIRQDVNESIHSYYERFIEVQDAMKSHGCSTDPEHLQARHFLQQLDRSKYGRFQTDLQNLVSSGAIPTYPRTVSAAYTLAKERTESPVSSYGHNRFTNPVVYNTTAINRDKKDKRVKKKDRPQGTRTPSGAGTCDLCGNEGHFIRTCPKLGAAKSAIAGSTRFTATTFGFEGDQAVFMSHSGSVGLRPTDILLDTQVNVSVFHNEQLLTDVREVEEAIFISGFVKGPAQRTSTVGTFQGVSPVYLAPEGSANILSFNQIERGNNKISWVRNSHFDVVLENMRAPIRFRVNKNGLYIADGSSLLRRNTHVMVTTVAEREQAYPQDQVKRAREARLLQELLGHVSTEALIRTISNGAMINAPVTGTDVLRAREIYGPAEANLQGSKRKDKQKAIGILEYVPKPLQEEQVLLADVMYVQTEPYLISVSYPLRLVMTTILTDKKASSLANALVSHVESYGAKGFKVTRVLTDPEAAFRAAGEIVRRHGIDFDEGGVEQHVARVEAMIKSVKERTRSIIHGLRVH
eukprot:gene12287-8788_t